MGSGADMSEEAKVLDRCDPFPVKLCPRCESLLADCGCDSTLRSLEEAVASWREACDKMERAMLDFLAATWRTP